MELYRNDIVLCKSLPNSLAADAGLLSHTPTFRRVHQHSTINATATPHLHLKDYKLAVSSQIGNSRDLHDVDFTDLFAAIPDFPLDPYKRSKVVRYLLLRWRPEAIANEVQCHVSTVYDMRRRLWLYGSISTPFRHTMSYPRKITREDEKRFINFLIRNPTANQREMI